MTQKKIDFTKPIALVDSNGYSYPQRNAKFVYRNESNPSKYKNIISYGGAEYPNISLLMYVDDYGLTQGGALFIINHVTHFYTNVFKNDYLPNEYFTYGTFRSEEDAKLFKNLNKSSSYVKTVKINLYDE